MRRNRSTMLVMTIWVLNAIGLIIILVGASFYFSGQKQAAPQPQALMMPGITQEGFVSTSLPQIIYPATGTPNTLATPITPVTPTTFVIQDGPQPAVIGFSVSGRPLEVYQFGQGEKQVMIVAGIHGGNEWNTIALADELIIFIVGHPEIIPSDVTLFILRDMNPDGDSRAHGIQGRVNNHGVDLNRNFPTNWQANWDRDGCWDYGSTTGGTSPGSEPETRAVMNFLLSHRIRALISYHSAALGVFPGGEPWDADSKKLAKTLSKATGYPYPPIDTGCYYTGTLADYAVSLGTTAVDMELTNHRDTDLEENLKALELLVNWH